MSQYKTLLVVLMAVMGLATAPLALQAQGRHDRKMAAIAASEEPQVLKGGDTFKVDLNRDEAFDAVLRYLKINDAVDEADKEVGQIFTAMEVTGRWRQKGRRRQVTVIEDGADKTIVRAAVTLQKRFKALQTEPWSEPTLDEEATEAFAKELRKAFTASASDAVEPPHDPATPP